jgi:hypothetical protein
VSTSSPARIPNATRRPPTAWAVRPIRNAEMGSTSRPSAELTKGLANTTASTARDHAPDTPSRRAVCAAQTASAADSSTVSRTRPCTGSTSPETSETSQVASDSISTLSGDVAALDSSVGIRPQCRSEATFRT